MKNGTIKTIIAFLFFMGSIIATFTWTQADVSNLIKRMDKVESKQEKNTGIKYEVKENKNEISRLSDKIDKMDSKLDKMGQTNTSILVAIEKLKK